MTSKLIHKLKQRGYKHNQIIDHIKSTPFIHRNETLKRKAKTQQPNKLVFVTQFQTINLQKTLAINKKTMYY